MYAFFVLKRKERGRERKPGSEVCSCTGVSVILGSLSWKTKEICVQTGLNIHSYDYFCELSSVIMCRLFPSIIRYHMGFSSLLPWFICNSHYNVKVWLPPPTIHPFSGSVLVYTHNSIRLYTYTPWETA
jgi:hypothetical protein